jgi:hypothetical protein
MEYLKDVAVPVNDPKRFRQLLYVILTSGTNAGTWLSPPTPAPMIVHCNTFTGELI